MKRIAGVITQLLKVAKPKFQFGHFQEFCENSTSLSQNTGRTDSLNYHVNMFGKHTMFQRNEKWKVGGKLGSKEHPCFF